MPPAELYHYDYKACDNSKCNSSSYRYPYPFADIGQFYGIILAIYNFFRKLRVAFGKPPQFSYAAWVIVQVFNI